MPDRAWLRVHVPEQNFKFDYNPNAWNEATIEGTIDWLIDPDMSDLEVEKQYFGPDGKEIFPYG